MANNDGALYRGFPLAESSTTSTTATTTTNDGNATRIDAMDGNETDAVPSTKHYRLSSMLPSVSDPAPATHSSQSHPTYFVGDVCQPVDAEQPPAPARRKKSGRIPWLLVPEAGRKPDPFVSRVLEEPPPHSPNDTADVPYQPTNFELSRHLLPANELLHAIHGVASEMFSREHLYSMDPSALLAIGIVHLHPALQIRAYHDDNDVAILVQEQQRNACISGRGNRLDRDGYDAHARTQLDLASLFTREPATDSADSQDEQEEEEDGGA